MVILKAKCWDFEWPEEQLQSVFSCPACGCEENELLFDNLVDNAFFVAPGKWKLYQCIGCNSAYLNPRPDQSSIHKAYGTYYTHEASHKAETLTKNLGAIRRVRRQLANGYYNYHHGTTITPANKLGAWLFFLYPKFRKSANAKFRYLPKPQPGQKLLDVGCGNGDFLGVASEAGWDVKGVEPDPKALETVRTSGFQVVQGSLEEIVDSGELFDAVTISHVIEHVHDPIDFVRLAYKCLKPGGILYVDTPNIQSSGAKRFVRNWRGIETPRHLLIFSRPGLETVLKKNGFTHLNFFSRREVRADIALKSYRMELGKSPYDTVVQKLPFRDRINSLLPRNAKNEEFLTVIARKV